MTQIACIILNYRDAKAAIKAAESVLASRGVKAKIYIVDNASNDGSVEILEQQNQGRFEVIKSAVNGGYAAGMNQGIKTALEQGAQYLWLLTQDITVEPDSLNHLCELWPRLERPGLLGSLTDFNGTDKLYFFRSFIENGHVRHRTKGRSIGDIPELKNEFGPTDYVNGACVFTHRSVIEKIGLIPEDYFMYFEDSDWGLAAQRAGFKNYVCYRSRAHHWRRLDEFNGNAEYFCRRNSYLFRKRNGFAKPWSKALEVLRLKKLYWKTRLKLAMGSKKQNLKLLAPILNEVAHDLKIERFGPRGN